jgi:hypothetical protein
MLIIVDADLTAPPSKVTCFRDITLYSSVFLNKEVVIECEDHHKDTYWYWLKNNYAWDYVEDIIKPFSEYGISIRSKKANITIPRIDYNSLSYVIGRLSAYS